MGPGKWWFKEELLSREIRSTLLNNNTALGLTLGLHRHSYRDCKAKCQADPTPWFYLWFQMNKARSNSSAEHIREQQSLLHGIATTHYSALPGDSCIASTFHGGGHQTNSHSDSAKGGTEFMGGPCFRATGSTSCCLQGHFFLQLGKQAMQDLKLSRPCEDSLLWTGSPEWGYNGPQWEHTLDTVGYAASNALNGKISLDFLGLEINAGPDGLPPWPEATPVPRRKRFPLIMPSIGS